MGKIDFYFDTKKVNEDIQNWRDLEIEVSFDDETGQGTVKSGSLEFVGDLAQKINNWNAHGMFGGPGIFEAPPLRIEACGNSVIFDGGINTAECNTSYECDKVVASLRSEKIDFINDRASSFGFAFLSSLPSGAPGKISQSDYVSVPYVINSIPDYVNIMVAGISLYVILKEFHEILEKTVAMVAELNGDVTATVVSIGATVAIVLADIIKIGFYILYLVFIIQAIISIIEMIFDNLIQPVKYKKGMRVITLMKRAAEYLGYTFTSILLSTNNHQNDVIVPRKIASANNTTKLQNVLGITQIKQKDYDDNKNPDSTGFPDWTFADLILAEEERLNAELRIIGNVLYFETKDFFNKFATYTIPNIQRKNADPHGTNACELASNYLLSYSLDSQDTNTYDDFRGTSCQMQLSPNIVLNKKNILLKNLTEITIQYALAKRKEKLNTVEEISSVLYTMASIVYNTITGFFNLILKLIDTILTSISFLTGGTAPTIGFIPPFPPNPIKARIGMMMLSSDFIGVPKILNVNSLNELHSNNLLLTAASTLMDELHFTNFAVRKITTDGTLKNDHNQWLTYTDKEIPFCCDDYNSLLKNNFCKTYDQKMAKVKSIVWKPDKSTAKITYRVKEQYTKNLNQSYIIDGKI